MNSQNLLLYLAGIFLIAVIATLWIAGNQIGTSKTLTYAKGQAFEEQSVSDEQMQKEHDVLKMIEVPVYRSLTKKIEHLPLEEYIIGVVAAEMPHDFEKESLKAQAITARTYIIQRVVEGNFSDVPTGAWVNDTVYHQAYIDGEQMKKKWGEDYLQNREKIAHAVYETVGQVITYQGRPITATFFSTSNGYTENSEEYWNATFPYLRSVSSPWDKESPRFKESVKVPIETFEKKLGVQIAHLGKESNWSRVIEKTTGKRIGKIQVGDKTFTGREIRELLDLNSSSFSWKVDRDHIIVTTLGYGHGVGMSQWGANGMAKEGKTAEEILKYYYQGIEIKDYRDWLRE